MYKYLLMLLIFLAGGVIAGDIYKWVDEQGRTNYSGTPPKNQRVPEMPVAGIPQQDQLLLYPPPGTQDPGVICQREALPQWLNFFCNFFTEKQWMNNGKPAFKNAFNGLDWVPFFDVESGLIEGLRQAGQGGHNMETRYAPWSRFFRGKYQCVRGKITNPFVFQAPNNFRNQLLGLSWREVRYDQFDPTGEFEEGSMFILFTLANLNKVYQEKTEVTLNKLLFNISLGRSSYKPDYQRDAEVVLVAQDGRVTSLVTLEQSAELLAAHHVLFTNDFMKRWSDGLNDAKLLASKINQPLIYMYMAQNILDLPSAQNTTYRKRFEYLIKKTQMLAPKATQLKIISHGWSSHIVASTIIPYTNVKHIALGPSPGPWNKGAYIHALKNTKATMKVIVGGQDFISPLSGGSYLQGAIEDCL